MILEIEDFFAHDIDVFKEEIHEALYSAISFA